MRLQIITIVTARFQHYVIKVHKPPAPSDPYTIDYRNVATGENGTETFDCVCVCSGLHNVPHVPHIPGIETFKGESTGLLILFSAAPSVLVGGEHGLNGDNKALQYTGLWPDKCCYALLIVSCDCGLADGFYRSLAGDVFHSSSYKDKEIYRNRRVVIVGCVLPLGCCLLYMHAQLRSSHPCMVGHACEGCPA